MVGMNTSSSTAAKGVAFRAALVCLALLTFSCESNIKDDLGDDGTDGGSAPSAPGALTVTPGNSQLTVSWSAVSGADSYDVYRHTADNSSAAVLFGNTTSTTSTITGLTNGTPYYVWVKAKNSAGSSAFSPAGSGTPVGGTGTSFTEEYLAGSSAWYVGNVAGTANAGAGEKITISKAYLPTAFSVYIHNTQVFKSPRDTGSPVSVTLYLAIWNASTGSSLGSAIAVVAAGQSGEIVFSIAGVTTIPANTPVLYAVYLPGALASNTRGSLLYYDSTSDPYSSGIFWRTNSGTDANVSTFSTWGVYGNNSAELKFKLICTEQ